MLDTAKSSRAPHQVLHSATVLGFSLRAPRDIKRTRRIFCAERAFPELTFATNRTGMVTERHSKEVQHKFNSCFVGVYELFLCLIFKVKRFIKESNVNPPDADMVSDEKGAEKSHLKAFIIRTLRPSVGKPSVKKSITISSQKVCLSVRSASARTPNASSKAASKFVRPFGVKAFTYRMHTRKPFKTDYPLQSQPQSNRSTKQ